MLVGKKGFFFFFLIKFCFFLVMSVGKGLFYFILFLVNFVCIIVLSSNFVIFCKCQWELLYSLK